MYPEILDLNRMASLEALREQMEKLLQTTSSSTSSSRKSSRSMVLVEDIKSEVIKSAKSILELVSQAQSSQTEVAPLDDHLFIFLAAAA
jgi:hypothetical protein